MDSQTYQENRRRLPQAELVRLRGQWAAFSLDGSRVIAASESLAGLDELIKGAGEDPEQVALERVDIDDLYVGGSEHF